MEEPLILEGGGAAPVSAGASLPPLHASQKWQWGMLVLCQLLMAFTFVSTWPLMPFIEFEFFNSNQPCVTANETATDGCQHAMALDSRWTGECSFVSQLAAFLLSPVVGKASDAIGRRPCLLALQLMLWAPWAALWFWSRSGLTLWLYFGLAKASPAISLYMAVAAGYVADVLPPVPSPCARALFAGAGTAQPARYAAVGRRGARSVSVPKSVASGSHRPSGPR
jgi:MFS family permease